MQYTSVDLQVHKECTTDVNQTMTLHVN